jgi:hypothetical protein
MASHIESELVSFHHFVAAKLNANEHDLSPEEVLDLWRTDHPLTDERDDATEALKEALASIAAGEQGIPFEEFVRGFRSRHGI